MKSLTSFVALATLLALPLHSVAHPMAATDIALASRAATGLDKAWKAKGRVFVGTASDEDRFSNSTNAAVTIREFGSVTPENSMKWDAVRACCVLSLSCTRKHLTCGECRLSQARTRSRSPELTNS